MSLNQIHLTTKLLTDLYSNVLIESSVATSMPDSEPFKYLGNNEKKILLLISNDTFVFLPDNELSFLINILAACKLSLTDVSIINTYKAEHDEIERAILYLEAKNIIFFGMEPLSIGLPINFPQYQLQKFNKRTYLYSPVLQNLENDKALKLKLWNCLKVLFSL